ncbi:MAG: PEP/pyruvate-binding domain-containing protein [Patescibacteria group bacterium]
MPSIPLLALAEFSQINARYIGNKAAQIGQLYKLKLPVPESLVIPSKILKDILFFNKLEDKFLEQLDSTDWENSHSVEASSKLIKNYIKTLKYPRELTKQLISEYQQRFKSDFVAIRLSPLAKTEDSLKNAYLNVKGDANLLHSVTSVWADHFDVSLLKKRYQEIKSGQFASTTIIIQKMIQSDSAGIAFTSNVEGLGKSIISIYSVWGIADNISQIQEIDKFFVSFSSQNIILRDLAIKTSQHKRKLDSLKIKKVSKNKQLLASLSDKQVLEIAKYVSISKRKSINHVALEWASEKNKIYILGITKDPQTSEQLKVSAKNRSDSGWKNQKTNTQVLVKNSDENQIYFPKAQSIELLSNPNLLKKEIGNFEKSKSKNKNSKLVLPFVRTVHELLLLKQSLNKQPVLLEFASPAPLLEIEAYLPYPIAGFSLNLKSIDLFLKGIDQNTSNINNLYTFDTNLIKKLLDRFFEKVHTSKRNFHIQIQLEKIDNEFLNYLLRKHISSILVKQNQLQYFKKRIFEIEEELIIGR